MNLILTRLPRKCLSIAQRKPVSAFVFVVGNLSIASILVHFGTLGWPGLHWDAALYGTPVLNVAKGNGWMFGSYGPSIPTRMPDLVFNFHGLLHVIIYGAFFNAKTWNEFLLQQGFINAFTFIVYSFLFTALLSRIYGFCTGSVASALSIASIPAILCIGLQGRPEQLAPLLLSALPICLLLSRSKSLLLACCGLSLGFVALLSPLVGVAYATILLLITYSGCHGSIKITILKTLLVLVFAGITVSAIIELLTPFSPIEWVMAISRAGGSSISFYGAVINPKYLFGLSMPAPLWNLIFIALAFTGVAIIWRQVPNKIGTIILFILLACLGANLALMKMADYTYAPFIPFLIAIFLLYRSPFGPRSAPESCPWPIRLADMSLLAVSITYSVVLIWFFMQSLTSPLAEVSLPSFRDKFLNLFGTRYLSNPHSTIGFQSVSRPSLVVLGDAGTDLVSFTPTAAPTSDQTLLEFESSTKRSVDYFILAPSSSLIRQGLNLYPPPRLYVGSTLFVLAENIPLGKSFKGQVTYWNPSLFNAKYSLQLYRRS